MKYTPEVHATAIQTRLLHKMFLANPVVAASRSVNTHSRLYNNSLVTLPGGIFQDQMALEVL